jgi:DNA-binding beta-propeller fold protein YncE
MRFRGIALALLLPASPASSEIFICVGDAVQVFADQAATNDPPLRVLTGGLTGISECYGVAVDPMRGELWVTTLGAVRVFALTAVGNVPPLRSITGPATGFNLPTAVAVDVEADEVIVAAALSPSAILTFPRSATGNQAPTRAIQGASTGLSIPTSIFVDRLSGKYFVANTGANEKVLVFESFADGDVSPTWTLGGSPAQLDKPRNLFIDRVAEVLYVSEAEPFLHKFSIGASNADPPLDTLSGASTQLTWPYGMTVTSDAELLVGNGEANSSTPDRLLVYDLEAPLPDQAPIRMLNAIAPANHEPYSIASTRALGCASGNVVSWCVFRDSFETGSASSWSPIP